MIFHIKLPVEVWKQERKINIVKTVEKSYLVLSLNGDVFRDLLSLGGKWLWLTLVLYF